MPCEEGLAEIESDVDLSHLAAPSLPNANPSRRSVPANLCALTIFHSVGYRHTGELVVARRLSMLTRVAFMRPVRWMYTFIYNRELVSALPHVVISQNIYSISVTFLNGS